MAISNFASIISGLQWPRHVAKQTPGIAALARPQSFWSGVGSPVAGSFDTTLNGVTLIAPVTGQIPFTDPPSGNTYLAQWSGAAAGSTGGLILILCDRLWHNGGIDATSTLAQSITSPTWPARDANGATSGDGVLLGLEVSAATGAGTPTITVSYTNQAGTAGRTGTNIDATAASSTVGAFYRIGLDVGDTGVRSVQSITLSATWTSGTVNLVAYRPIAILDSPIQNARVGLDAITAGFPRFYNGSVPFMLGIGVSVNLYQFSGTIQFTQG